MRVLVQPLPLLLLLLGALLVRLWVKVPEARKSLRWFVGVYLLLWFICTPLAGWLALRSLECREPPPDPDDFPKVDAIVILGSALLPVHALPGRAELDGAGLDRVRHGASLYLRGRAPLVIVSGGRLDEYLKPSLAERMADELRRMGVPKEAIVLEDESTSTRENAVESARLLEHRGLSSVLLVTDAQHMPRAVATFRERGLDTIPAACRYRTYGHGWSWRDVVPSLDGVRTVEEGWTEWILMLRYRVNGWVGGN